MADYIEALPKDIIGMMAELKEPTIEIFHGLSNNNISPYNEYLKMPPLESDGVFLSSFSVKTNFAEIYFRLEYRFMKIPDKTILDLKGFIDAVERGEDSLSEFHVHYNHNNRIFLLRDSILKSTISDRFLVFLKEIVNLIPEGETMCTA